LLDAVAFADEVGSTDRFAIGEKSYARSIITTYEVSFFKGSS
jgi:hypothetical protein